MQCDDPCPLFNPKDTQGYFDVYTMSITLGRRRMNVKKTMCVLLGTLSNDLKGYRNETQTRKRWILKLVVLI